MSVYKSVRLLLLAYIIIVWSDTFEYVVAGGRTAGLVVANRLFSRPDTTVTITEVEDKVQGQPDVQMIDFDFASFNTFTNYQYPTVASPALGSKNPTYRARTTHV